MVHDLSLSYQSITLVLRAKSNLFCRCEGGNCSGDNCDCSRTFTIPDDCIKEVAGTLYVKLSRKNNSIRRLLCCFAHASEAAPDDEIFGVLGKVTIIDDLVTEREMAVRMHVGQCSRQRAEKMHPKWRKWKKHQQGLAAVPEVLCVTSPQLGDIPSCELKMLSENLKTKGPSSVLVELTSQSLGWLCSAIDWQFRQGTFSSGYVISREKRRKVDTASESGVNEGSDDNDGGRGSDNSSSDESNSSDRDEFPQEQADEAQHEQPEYIAQETDEVPEAASSVLVIAEDDMAEDDMPRRELLEPAAGGKEKAPEKATKQLMLSDMFRKPSK